MGSYGRQLNSGRTESLRRVFRVGLRSQPLHRFQSRRHRVRPRPWTPHLRLQLFIEIIYIGIRRQLGLRRIAARKALRSIPKRLIRT